MLSVVVKHFQWLLTTVSKHLIIEFWVKPKFQQFYNIGVRGGPSQGLKSSNRWPDASGQPIGHPAHSHQTPASAPDSQKSGANQSISEENSSSLKPIDWRPGIWPGSTSGNQWDNRQPLNKREKRWDLDVRSRQMMTSKARIWKTSHLTGDDTPDAGSEQCLECRPYTRSG